MTPTTDTRLQQVVDEFESIGITPELARDQCGTESFRFMLALEDAGIDSERIDGFSFGTLLGKPIILNGHTAVRVGDQVYDWTARQFDPDAPHPLVCSVQEWRQTWKTLPRKEPSLP